MKRLSQPARWTWRETALAVWILLAGAAAVWTTVIWTASFPVFTFLLLGSSLAALLWSRDAGTLGFRPVPRALFWRTVGIALLAWALLMALFEPWSHTYDMLLTLATARSRPDPTFVWLVRSDSLFGLLAMLLYSGFVSLFAEELFFRGWLLGWLRRRLHPSLALLAQASLFTLPQLLAAALMPWPQGPVYALIYAWAAIGLVGGWAAARTRSFWPSLFLALVANLSLIILLRVI